MNIKDLKTGMVIEFKNKQYSMVLLNTTNGNIHSGQKYWGSICDLDLKNDKDVVGVWQPLNNMSYFLGREINSGHLASNSWELVWERQKKMTKEEIERELGYEIEIVEG